MLNLQNILQKKYNRLLFAKEVLSPIFNSGFNLFTQAVDVSEQPNKSESKVIQQVQVYGKITLDDYTEINCYEILLQPNVRIERSRVAIQHYVRKILTTGQAALINFVSPTYENVWRLTFVAKDSVLTEKGVKEKATHARRYTYLLGSSETCRTAAERFEAISTEKQNSLDLLIKAFSVERLSKIFFDEYKTHYERFIEHLSGNNIKVAFFKNDDKAVRDFTKKLLGRIVFLYFVQKKGWLGATDTNYSDGDTDFMMQLFISSGANDTFYANWLSKLFFDTLNTKDRKDDFEMPNGKKVKIPYLNGGLFDKEEHDNHILVFKAHLFHNAENPDDPKERGFLDFLNSFNFTVFEDSPEEHTVAVDPEMLGHIFENLLEDNKDKGAFYTPKEIVHYMCQETLTEYLATQLAKEYKVYRKIGDNQFEMFGNESRTGQLSMIEEIGDKALDREFVEHIVQAKDISGLTPEQLRRIDNLLDTVKICDPAIGSGAFPMGLLLEIFAIKEVIAYQLELPWNPATVKENIIQNSIYGVDIEKGAVDIARLRFWLSLVVDEVLPKPLPNLDYKIVVGNSLVSKFEDEIIEIDWSTDTTSVGVFAQENRIKTIELLKIISGKQHEYFHAENSDKKKLSLEIRNLKIDLLINQLDQMVKTKGIEAKPTGNGNKIKEQTELYLKTEGWKKTIKSLESLKKDPNKKFAHFDWKLDFPDVLNPLLNKTATYSPDIQILNRQIIALNAEIDAINAHLEKSKQDLRILRLQLTVANKQINITKAQLDDIENRVKELLGTITKVEKNIVSEPTDITYKISSINKEIEGINQRIDEINPIISSSGNSGFDIVIGNPPYISNWSLSEIDRDFVILLEKKYKDFLTGHWDIFLCFIPKSIEISKKNGVCSFILPTSFYKEKHSTASRLYFTDKLHILELLDFEEEKIFEEVARQTGIFLVKNEFVNDSFIKIKNGIDATPSFIPQVFFKSLKNCAFKLNVNENDIKIYNGINHDSDLLGKYVCINTGVVAHAKAGSPIKFTKDDVIHKEVKEGFKKYIIGSNISQYHIRYEDDYIDYESKKNYFHRPKYPLLFESEKIVVRRISGKNNSLLSCFDNEKYYTNDNIMHLVKWSQEILEYQKPEKKWVIFEKSKISLKYLTGILNSKLVTYFFKKFLSTDTLQGSYSSIYPEDLRQIPIKNNFEIYHNLVIFIVDYILFLKMYSENVISHTTNDRITSHIADILDMMVYELYFEDHMKKNGIDVLQFIQPKPIDQLKTDEEKAEVIKDFYLWYQKPENPVRQRMLLVETRSPEILALINKSIH